MTVRILQGDCREVLKTLETRSVQCAVTSPPYFRLRDAGDPRQIGMEDTPEEYIAALTDVFNEVHRILSSTGLLFLNLGDSYKNKRRLMIPARVAIALDASGWLLVDEIVWHKPRTTPRSYGGRTTPAHEMIYLLAKSEDYYFDYKAIMEPAAYAGLKRMASHAFRDLGKNGPNPKGERPTKADRMITVGEKRRKRSVWSVSPPPYEDGHFSTMPPEIAETCILAGSRVGDMVLDPFYGAGTTGIVADRLGRDCVGIELIADHGERSARRLIADAGLFASIE